MIWLISLICFALPTYLIRFKIFGIPTTALEVLIYLAVLIQAVIILKSKIKNHKSAPREASAKWGNILFPFLLFLLAAVISVIISPDKRTSLGVLKGWLVDPILLFWLIVWNVKTQEDFKKIIYGLCAGASVVSLWGILQAFGFSYLLPHQRIDPFSSFYSYLATRRAFGPFESPNYLGMYIAPIAALAAGYWLNFQFSIFNFQTNLKSKILSHKSGYFLSFALSSMFLALYLTKSFGAWLGFSAALLVLIWLYLPKNKKQVFLAFLVITILIGAAIIFKYKPQRILDSFAARVEVWQVSLFLVKEHPIFGIGLGTFPKIYNQVIPYIHFPPINWLQMHPHNIFLAFWLNMGILGLFSFLWFLVKFFRDIKYRLTNSSRAYSICWTVAMVAILTHGLLDTTYWKNDLSAIFWIVFGLAFITSRKRQNENS